MITTIDIKVNAAHPNMPLPPSALFQGSAATFRIIDVPKPVGRQAVSKVYVSAKNADGAEVSAECVRTGGCWTGTIPGEHFAASGFVGLGVTVSADGMDENGDAVEGWILGKGDLAVLSSEGQVVPGETRITMYWFAEQPSAPKEGYMSIVGGVVCVYTDGAWKPLGGGSTTVSWGDITGKPTAFTPSAHASTHAANGSDPITVAQSQVTGLASALAEKATLEDLGVHDMADDAHQELFDGKLNRADVISPSSAEVEGYAADAYETKNALAEKAAVNGTEPLTVSDPDPSEGMNAAKVTVADDEVLVESAYPQGSAPRHFPATASIKPNGIELSQAHTSGQIPGAAIKIGAAVGDLQLPGVVVTVGGEEYVAYFPSATGSPLSTWADFSLTNPASYVSSLFSNANTANNLGNIRVSAADATTAKQYIDGNIRYDIATSSSATMADRAINQLTMAADTPLVFPAAVSGKARDFLLNLTYTSGEMTLPQGVTKVGDELTFTAGKTYLLAFTEIAANQFYIRAIDITTTEA